jgi:peptidylprolyl isomerase
MISGNMPLIPMSRSRCLLALAALFAAGATRAAEPTASPAASPAAAVAARSMADVLAATKPSDWRPLDPENTLYLDLPTGRVVIELAPAFAPNHVLNVKALAREGYFDGLAILRAQDNYVVQWGDPNGDDEKKKRPIKKAKATLPAEFDRAAADLPFTRLPDGDVYAPEVGLSAGFPAARDPKSGRAWLAHCYGMLGAGRGNDAASGGGTELYVVIGHSPRHLDRNVTLVGRVASGIERLSVQPRGAAAMGFYSESDPKMPILKLRVAADVPPAERVSLEVLRTDTPAFAALVDVRPTRREEWFKQPVERIELCNVPIPVRPVEAPKKP